MKRDRSDIESDEDPSQECIGGLISVGKNTLGNRRSRGAT